MTFNQWWYDFKIKNHGRQPERSIAEAAWAAARMAAAPSEGVTCPECATARAAANSWKDELMRLKSAQPAEAVALVEELDEILGYGDGPHPIRGALLRDIRNALTRTAPAAREKIAELEKKLAARRPFSDKMAQEVIDGQVKEIDRLTKLVQEVRAELVDEKRRFQRAGELLAEQLSAASATGEKP